LQKKIRKLDKNFKPPASYYRWDVDTRLQWTRNLHGALDDCKTWAGACVSAEYFKTGGNDPGLALVFDLAFCMGRMCEGPIGHSAVIDFAAGFVAGPTVGAARGLLARLGASAATETGVGGISALSKAGDYGIWPYSTLRPDLKGSGLQAHHLIEQRFAAVMGQQSGRMASIAVTGSEHQVFTNLWRQAIAYGAEGTGMATRMQVEDAARRIYADYPDILKALGL
jgi:hypothetical protein